jgi:hypothetical protein
LTLDGRDKFGFQRLDAHGRENAFVRHTQYGGLRGLARWYCRASIWYGAARQQRSEATSRGNTQQVPARNTGRWV